LGPVEPHHGDAVVPSLHRHELICAHGSLLAVRGSSLTGRLPAGGRRPSSTPYCPAGGHPALRLAGSARDRQDPGGQSRQPRLSTISSAAVYGSMDRSTTPSSTWS